jgi:hypothetical protein
MKRTKEWWKRLTKDERSRLYWLEHQKGSGYSAGGYLPDDCSECGCGSPMLGAGGFCPVCSAEYNRILNKANQEAH